MWNQDLIEILKLLASIATPLTIALVGLLINRAIQRQNAIAQRQSSWLTKWADEFLGTAAKFDDSATGFLMIYWLSHAKSINEMPEAAEEQKTIHLDCIQQWSNLQRALWELTKYTSFAPHSGRALKVAAEAVDTELGNWMRNKGGDVQTFREKQIAFNAQVREVHAELLRIEP